MTKAELVRRYREKLKAEGGRHFSVRIEGLHLAAVEEYASARANDPSVLLKNIFQNALDRFTGVVRRAHRLSENGASDAEIAQFIEKHLWPELPPMQPRLTN